MTRSLLQVIYCFRSSLTTHKLAALTVVRSYFVEFSSNEGHLQVPGCQSLVLSGCHARMIIEQVTASSASFAEISLNDHPGLHDLLGCSIRRSIPSDVAKVSYAPLRFRGQLTASAARCIEDCPCLPWRPGEASRSFKM